MQHEDCIRSLSSLAAHEQYFGLLCANCALGTQAADAALMLRGDQLEVVSHFEYAGSICQCL